MKRSGWLILAVVLMLVTTLFLMKERPSLANPGQFDGVVPFSTSEGLIALFDRNDGRIYIYDGTLTKCLQVAQVDELGQPMKILQKNF